MTFDSTQYGLDLAVNILQLEQKVAKKKKKVIQRDIAFFYSLLNESERDWALI